MTDEHSAAMSAADGAGVAAIRNLDQLQSTWNNIVLTGKPNGLAEKPDLLASLNQVGGEFEKLRHELLDAFSHAGQRETAVELGMRAQISVDILIRNLFERTADVGFLAEDVAILDSLAANEAGADLLPLRQRLDAYIAKYSVYDDIAIYRPDGKLHVTRLGETSRFADGHALVAQVLTRPATFHEIFHAGSDGSAQLIYAQGIHRQIASGHKQVIGVLALSFRFADEMSGIFADLLGENPGGVVLAILDGDGQAIASSDADALPVGTSLTLTESVLQPVTLGERPFLATRRPTKGYQGFFGLGWSGVALRPANRPAAKEAAAEAEAHEAGSIAKSEIVSDELKRIFGRAYAIDTDLHLIGLNGKIAADRENNRVLPAVLGSIREIGEGIRNAVHGIIDDLYDQARRNLDRETRQMAALGVNIMDRNLYERANDCRWWALTPAFRRILAARGGKAPQLGAEERGEIGGILAYVNSLYTVYSLLLVFDAEGVVVAGSRGDTMNGQTLSGAHIAAALANRDPQGYFVSDFVPSPLYGGQPTYVYCGTILSPDGAEAVGGVAVVFDSAPQFRQMLLDVLPQREGGAAYRGGFAAFVNEAGILVASTDPAHGPAGEPFDPKLLSGHAILARSTSPGYREFKRSDAYVDTVTCVIAIPG
ncbi:MAG TPA: hypothetical protein VG742_05710 [Dongiaceae bacterium]|nr:hypothetical protein [Dongiaceae bacterium]